jgi:ferredoxin
MGLSLNDVVKPQKEELNKRAVIYANDKSPTKRLYVEGGKSKFSKSDIGTLLKNIGSIYRLPMTLSKAVKLIKSDNSCNSNTMTYDTFVRFEALLKSLGVDDYGFFEISSNQLFKDCGVPHKYALVFSSGMSYDAFKSAPSMICQLEVAKVYSVTGDISNKVSEFLQSEGFGASPNHSMGGQIDYSMALEWAGIGIVGRHSMAITKKNGPCHRVSVVYTNIENLSDFINNNIEDLYWIKDFCQKCGKCIRSCPTNAIYSEPLTQEGQTPTRINYENCCEGFQNYGCGLCIKACPFSSGNYEKLKSLQLKKEW